MDEDREESTLLTIVHTREQPLRKLEKSLASLAWGGGDVTVDADYTAAVAAASTDLSRFELQAFRARNASIAAVKEIEASNAIRKSLEERSKAIEVEIRELRTTLEKERIEKANRERYTALAKVISTITARSASEREIDTIAKKITELEAVGEALTTKKEHLGKQFLLLTQTLEDIAQVVDEKSAEKQAEDSAAKTAAAAVAAATAASHRAVNDVDLMEAEEGEAADEVLEEGEARGDDVTLGEQMEVEEGEEEEEDRGKSPPSTRMEA